MAKWAMVVSEERYSQERLYACAVVPGAELPAGDEALLVAALDPPVVFGVARADAEGRLRYTVNLIDAPLPFAAPSPWAAPDRRGAAVRSSPPGRTRSTKRPSPRSRRRQGPGEADLAGERRPADRGGVAGRGGP